MSALATLTAARARIADPAAWTQDADARDANGWYTPPEKPDAVCWCANGALRGEGVEFGTGPFSFLYRAGEEQHGKLPGTINDELGHAAVLAMYDRAIALAAAEAEAR